jgi:hypothetical protein
MNDRQRLSAVFGGQIPDKVPHLELVYQLEQEAFGACWPSRAETDAATPAERERLLSRFIVRSAAT